MGEVAESNLEMRCSADEAWYDGTLKVSLESKDLIVVHFNDFDDDEDETFHRSELRDPEKLRSRVRVRSVQLQDSQCRRVYEDQKICGCLDDGEDRKYYDAKVFSVVKKKHSFKDDGEECLCKFRLFWVDGPRKGDYTDVGCAEVCFLSPDAPEDDPMVKDLLTSLAGNGDQPRRKLAKSVPKSVPKRLPKSVPSPRPRTPSPSLELAPSKKQPSREPSPPAALPNHKVLELARTRSLPIASKKKRIMQVEELTELASANDKLEIDGRQISAPKDSRPRSEERGEEPIGHGDESDAPEWRLVSGGSEGQKSSEQAVQKKRLVKGKAKVGAPEVVDRQEAAREDVMQDIPRRTIKEGLKLSTAKMATLVEGAIRDKDVRQDMIIQSLGERVKLIKTAKMAAPAAAAAAPPPRDEEKIVQSLGERVKLKIAKKNPASSPVEARKVGLQKIGKLVVGKPIMKRKLIQLEDPTPDPLSSKFDKVVKPRTPWRPKDMAAEPNNVESHQPKVQKRKAGRPRKHPLREPAKPATESTIAKKQQVAEICSEQMQSRGEEEIVDPNAENGSSDHANNHTKKRPRDEESSQDDSANTSQEDETLDAHVRKPLASGPANKGKKKKMIIGDHDGVLPHDDDDDDTVSGRSAHTNDMAADHHEDHSPPTRNPEDANETSCHLEKISMGERVRDIENKYRISSSCFSSPQAAQELIILAGTEHYRETPTDEEHFRVTAPHENSASHLGAHQEKADETGARGKRQVGMEDRAMAAKREQGRHGSDIVRGQDEQGECSPGRPVAMSDAEHPWPALEADTGLGRATRLLLLENLEPDASALGALQVLQSHTEGVCAVHVLPVCEFQVFATGFALYRDSGSALKALRWLTSSSRFVVSPKGRPWIVSQSREVYGPRLCGFAAHTAYKSDDPGMCGVISDQSHAHDLVVVTKRDNSAYFQALQMSKSYGEHKKWRKELYERIVQHEKKG